MSRPLKGTEKRITVSLTLDPAVLAEVQFAGRGRSRSEVVEEALVEWLQRCAANTVDRVTSRSPMAIVGRAQTERDVDAAAVPAAWADGKHPKELVLKKPWGNWCSGCKTRIG